VFNDTNGGTVDGIGTNSGATYLSIVSGGSVTDNGNGTSTVTGGTILTTVPVDGDGSFSLTGLISGTYRVVLHTSVGGSLTTALNAGWLNTGEGIGATPTATDGLTNGITEVVLTTSNAENVNFGIQQPPIAGNGANSAANPGYDQQVDVPASAFANVLASSDVAPGTLTSIRITAFPSGASSIVVEDPNNGDFNIYYPTVDDLPMDCFYSNCLVWPVGGITIPVNAATGEPTVYISVDPIDFGPTQVIIPFVAIDNAGAESANTGQAVLNLTAVCDLTPRILLLPAVTNGTQEMEITISVFELNNVATDGSTITLAVSKNSLLGSFSYNPGQTENQNGDPMNNSSWSLSENDGFYIFTTTNVIGAEGALRFAFKLTMTPGATRGEFPISAFLVGGSGGEVYFNNNDDDEVLIFFE
jgi:hypothetical protein